MSGTFDVESPPVDMAQERLPILVCRYTPTPEGTDPADFGPYRVVPRLRAVKVEYKEGKEPPTAQFVYAQDDSDPAIDDPDADDQVPRQFEDYWPSSTKDRKYLVTPDDRVVVLAVTGWEDQTDPSDLSVTSQPKTRILFDGYPRVPQTNVDPGSQSVTVLAVGVAIRCWDKPIKNILMRDADQPTTGEAVFAALPTHFNPDGRPNCVCKDGYYSPEVAGTTDRYGDSDFPIFLDPRFTRDPAKIDFWTLDKAVAYILAVWNDQEFVQNPDFHVLESLLRNRKPKEGAQFFDPANPETYQESPVILRDVDVSGHPWPEAVERLLGYAGFGMRFVCEDDEDSEPYNYLEIYRKDNDGPNDPKEVNFPRAARLDEEVVDVQHLHVAHDYHSVFNQILIETKALRAEVGVVLAPGYEPSQADSASATRDRYKRGHLDAHPEYRNDYRLYVADECGDGHWDMAAKDWSVTPMDFKPIFPDDSEGNRTYVRRYRPGSINIHTPDRNGKPIKTQLALSRDYAGPTPPCIWDGTGTWQVIQGGFELLKERLGIWVSANDPADWEIGDPAEPGTAQEPTRKLDGLTSQANMMAPAPPAGVASLRSRPFYLRLVTTIEADFDLTVFAERRASSPIKHAINRVIDCKDHFTRQAVLKSSPFYKVPDGKKDGDPAYVKDQTKQAQTHADQLRAVHEFPPVAGGVVIPQVTFAYNIGDRISKINGREVSLRGNSGQEQGDGPAYPFIVSLTWQFNTDRQSTTFQVTDRRAEPQHVTGKSRA